MFVLGYYCQLKTCDRKRKWQIEYLPWKLDRQLTGQSTGASSFLAVGGEQQHKAVVFNESNILDIKLDKLTSMVRKPFTQIDKQSHSSQEYTIIEEDP